jgi:flagellar biosynthesis protein
MSPTGRDPAEHPAGPADRVPLPPHPQIDRKLAIALGGGLSSAASGSGSPFVAASGRGLIAEDIIALAEQHGIPVEHDPVLVGLLGGLRVGQFVPPEMYQAIAELLVFLYDLDAQLPDIPRYE